jgi:hypothetical protein
VTEHNHPFFRPDCFRCIISRDEVLTQCPTECDDDCTAACHEEHQVPIKRTHAREHHRLLNLTNRRS